MYSTQLNAYQTNNKTTLSGRELEASVLSKAAVMLKQCQEGWEAADLTQMLSEALNYNQKVWSFFQTEIANPDNPLPKKLKEDLLSLSIFVDKRIFEIMSYPAPEKLTAIININLNIAAGLRNSPSI
jgi:flagellar biosynthesis activator protein FlaF